MSRGNNKVECYCMLPLSSLLPSSGDGKHRDPCGAQHPDDGGPGLHWHQLVCQSCMSRLLGSEPLSPLEGPPAGLVCCSCAALLSAFGRCGAQLRSARSPGGVPEGGVTRLGNVKWVAGEMIEQVLEWPCGKEFSSITAWCFSEIKEMANENCCPLDS